jgi:two-component system, response regulator
MRAPVLLVDDDPDDTDLMWLAFRRHGASAQLEVAHDAGESIDQLTSDSDDRSHDLPTVVLLDLKLQRACGFEMLRRLRRSPRTASLPVVVLTSSAEPRDLETAYAAGANAYVRKPDSLEELMDVVGAILSFWVRCNQMPHWPRREEIR